MTSYLVGVDLGATKSHLLVADETGRAIGFAADSGANHERVGYESVTAVVQRLLSDTLSSTGLRSDEIAGAAIGASGFDWESERPTHLAAFAAGGFRGFPVDVVNDAVVGLLAGATSGWGVGLVAGTGCNCWGIDRRQRYGRVLGLGGRVGEFAGGTALAERAVWAVARAATMRGPATGLSDAFVALTGAGSVERFLEGYCEGRLRVPASAAPLVFEQAARGDAVAQDCIAWAAHELADLAIGVVRQLGFERQAFDLVLIGSLFKGGPLLTAPLLAAVHAVAPGARPVPLEAPPVLGAVLLAMANAGIDTSLVRDRLIESSRPLFPDRAVTTGAHALGTGSAVRLKETLT